MTETNKETIDEELSRIKEEMKEIKELLKDKRDNINDEDNFDDSEGTSRNFKFDFGTTFDDIDIDVDSLDVTINQYLASVMSGIKNNFAVNMRQFSRDFSRFGKDATREADRIKREAERVKRDLDREKRRISREFTREQRDIHRTFKNKFKHYKTESVEYRPLEGEELEQFFESSPALASALSDSRRLKLLKSLENGPAYQGELSEKTDLKGGTFKHHMDILLQTNFVYQEQTRGRYLITQLGVEALKLVEILFRRLENETKSEEIAVNVTFDEDEADIDVVEEDEDLSSKGDN
ncbi:MAG: winged helix-turn-helix domain-containing protein [Candidatus Heimdallarchaeota archaeon]|nr:winged helix-turn-helix domain-containing protein [Candidatus Heimdallarchaeota archaeon]MDH5645352.1 winged helix-turn-helix domain-containing protein [Candidatus Heimdallarchaeota archaeon]